MIFQRSKRLRQRRVKRGRDARGGHTQQRRAVKAIERGVGWRCVPLIGGGCCCCWTSDSSVLDNLIIITNTTGVPAAKWEKGPRARQSQQERATALWNCGDSQPSWAATEKTHLRFRHVINKVDGSSWLSQVNLSQIFWLICLGWLDKNQVELQFNFTQVKKSDSSRENRQP